MLMGQLLSPHLGRDPAPITASCARAWPVPPERSPKAQASPVLEGGGMSYGGWHFALQHPRMKIMWVESLALKECVGIFSIASPPCNLPNNTAAV